MSDSPILQVVPLGFQWPTIDPFLFCVHHDDAYPPGNAHMGPEASLDGRDIGQDFAGKDGWRMYHGEDIPGFPGHPHRGFETVTIVLKGHIDHADSLGATARFGEGDVQWLTAGKGIVHAEMFPLLKPDAPNPTELFQIWLNLPRASKFAEPHFQMMWKEALPRVTTTDAAGKRAHVLVVAGDLGPTKAPAPPPDSWAARAEADVAIWAIDLEAGATWGLPATAGEAVRVLYFFEGDRLLIGGEALPVKHGAVLDAEADLVLTAGAVACRALILQGRPIGEPVVQHGPFVMNTREEIQDAFQEFQATGFGGWPWPAQGPVHPRDAGRFARFPDGREERPRV